MTPVRLTVSYTFDLQTNELPETEVVKLVADILPLVALFQIADGLSGVTGGILRARGKQVLGALLNIRFASPVYPSPNPSTNWDLKRILRPRHPDRDLPRLLINIPYGASRVMDRIDIESRVPCCSCFVDLSEDRLGEGSEEGAVC